MSVARVYRVGSPYNGVELAELDFEQSADVVYLAHIDHKPGKLLRYDHADWRFVDVSFGPTIVAPGGVTATATTPVTTADSYFPQPATYYVTAVNDATGQESRIGSGATVSNDLTLKKNYNTVSWSAVTGATAYRVYKAPNELAPGYIGTTTQTTFRDDNIGPDLTQGPPAGSNPFDIAGNWPSTVAFFQQRLFWARTRNQPNGIYGSRSGQTNFENMDTSTPLRDNDALSFAIVGQRVNAVNQLVGSSGLLALSSDAVFNITGGTGDVLTPTNPVPRRQIGRGASRLNPIAVDSVVFFRPVKGSSVRAINYSFEVDGIKSDDVSIYSPHFFEGFDIKSWAYCEEPNSLIWAVRSDGKLLCFTWEQEQQVWGWTLCETDGEVESVCSITEAGEDRLYLTVWRTVQGVRRLYIERMASSHWERVEECCFLDCATTFVFDAPTRVLVNLGYLEGRVLSALVDGSVFEGLIVVNGTVTLPVPGTYVTIGLPYAGLIKTLPVAFEMDGTNIAKHQHVGEIVVRVMNTRGVLAGPDEKNLFEIKPRSMEDYGAPNDLHTGDLRIDAAPVASHEACAVISLPYPLPATITAVLLDPVVTG